jgi:hypothetical protein
MIMRTQRRFVVFSHPFVLKGIDRLLPPGSYEVVTDEELIEGLSFPVYRRVSTSMIVPAQSHHASAVEMQTFAGHRRGAYRGCARNLIESGTRYDSFPQAVG